MDDCLQDLRYAIRNYLNAPAFTAVALITLALGIGSTTAMFTVVNSVLLRPLPYPDPGQLVAINEFDSDHPVPELPEEPASFPDYQDVAALSHSYESVGAYTFGDYTLSGTGAAVRVNGQMVTSNLFHVLGVRAALGRTFAPGEDGPRSHVAILSDHLWRRRFNADPNVIGGTIILEGVSYTVVGVMPPGFQLIARAQPSDIWITFSLWAEMNGGKGPTTQRGNHSIFIMGRLKPGVTLAQANSELTSIYRAMAEKYPDKNKHTGIAARPQLAYVVGTIRTSLLFLFAAVGLVMLIACSNVASLLIARGAARTGEIAIRSALGATRARVVRMLVTESLMLSLGGALLGSGIAVCALKAILKLYPENLPRASGISMDTRVLLFNVTLAVVNGFVFGLLPAWRASAPNLVEAMLQGSRTSSVGPHHVRVRAALVVAETALGVMLMISAGLFMRSFERLAHVDVGFEHSHLLTASFDFSRNFETNDDANRAIADFVDRVRALPGVTDVGGSLPLPLGGADFASVGFNRLDRPVPESQFPSAGFYLVTGEFFRTMQIPLLQGRLFDPRDQRNSAPVMIISHAFANRFFAGEDPIGKKIYIGAGEGSARERYQTREVIGVVGDIRITDLGRQPAPAFYVPLSQMLWGTPHIIVRTATPESALAPEIAKSLAALDPGAPLYDVRTMSDWLAFDLGRVRFQTILLALFAGMALLMTAVGLYGVIAYTVTQRTHEIGVRVALGASPGKVLSLLLRQGVRLVLVGIAIGSVATFAFAKIVAALLYQVRPRDPITFIGVCLMSALVGLVASGIPALRATRIAPWRTLLK